MRPCFPQTWVLCRLWVFIIFPVISYFSQLLCVDFHPQHVSSRCSFLSRHWWNFFVLFQVYKICGFFLLNTLPYRQTWVEMIQLIKIRHKGACLVCSLRDRFDVLFKIRVKNAIYKYVTKALTKCRHTPHILLLCN